MDELAQTLIGNGVGAPPTHILEFIDDETAHRGFPGAPHSIYEEIWHLAFWQQLSLDWIGGKSTPYPEHASDGFPASSDEVWPVLHERFLRGAEQAARIAGDDAQLEVSILCPHAILRHRVPSGSRATRIHRGSQCLSPGPHRSAASALRSVATAFGWRHLVRNPRCDERLQAKANQERFPTVKLPAIFFILIRKFLRATQRAC